MKLKKTIVKPAAAPKPEGDGAGEANGGGAAIASRFKLDLVPEASKAGPEAVGRKAAMFAMIASLLSLALLGGVAFMLYTNWDYAKGL